MGGFDNPLVIPGRHSEGSNFLFCDGHAKWSRGDAVSPGRNAPGASAAAFAPGGASNAVGTGNLTGPGGIRFAYTFSLE
jgi:prepilin-type processing-associated H-X9-DG protein